MRLRAFVVEDEWVARNYLVGLLQASGAIDVVGAVGRLDDARAVLDEPGAIDVAFVDVQLVGEARDDAGLELVRGARGRPDAPLFVLATAHAQHALEAYDLGVVDYLRKPFTEARVADCVARLRARAPITNAAAPARIVGRRRRALVFVRTDEVRAFEAADRLTYVHTTRERLDVDLSLAAIEATFGRTFLRVHRSWLVNLDHVAELDGGELVVGGTGLRVPVARDRIAAVRDALLAGAAGLRPR